MIDTFAFCGKSTWEKILLPKLFKQTMVKFSFLVTNLTFQESDSSLAEREELMPAWGPWLTDSPKSHIHLKISWHPHSVCVLLWQRTKEWLQHSGGMMGKPEHVTWQSLFWDKWSLSDTLERLLLFLLLHGWAGLWFKLIVFFFFSCWFDLTFCDKEAPETKHVLTMWKWLGLEMRKGKERKKEKAFT